MYKVQIFHLHYSRNKGSYTMIENSKIAVVGAGPSGLVSLKYALDYGYDCDVFEQTGSIGGNWVYTENIGFDENGVEIQSSIYKDMISHVPKEIMEYRDLSYPDDIKESYIPHPYVLEYHHAYAEKFDLKKHIQFFTRVTHIIPTNDERWILTIQDVKTKTEKQFEYDVVFICHGRYRCPYIPKIPGQDLFNGIKTHSSYFRVSNPYEGKTVIVIGAGRSGTEISLSISKVAKQVFLSCYTAPNMQYPHNLMVKPEITEFKEDGAIFKDGSKEVADVVIYCTGYSFSCNFLDEKCGVRFENNGVAPLYKQIINIEYPSMYFIGIPFSHVSNIIYDLQVRFAMAALNKKFVLPPKMEMLKEWEDYLKMEDRENVPKRAVHKLHNSKEMKIYANDLEFTANIPKVPSVIYSILERIIECNRARHFYKIIDDDKYEEMVP